MVVWARPQWLKRGSHLGWLVHAHLVKQAEPPPFRGERCCFLGICLACPTRLLNWAQVSKPYVDMTVKIMERFGVEVQQLNGLQHMRVREGGAKVWGLFVQGLVHVRDQALVHP